MIQKIITAFLLPAFLLLAGCSKNASTNNEANDLPVPKAQNDLSNFGLYRGVFVGSKGTVTVNVNNDNHINATLKIDGTAYYLGTTQVIQQNQSTTINFTGGSNSFSFTADANGANPVVSNLVFTRHPNAKIALLKSLSYSWADIFECTYKENTPNTGTGVFMMAIVANVVKGLGSDNSFQNIFSITGTQGNNHVVCKAPYTTGFTDIVGDVTPDNSRISGTFSNSGGTGTWSGVRIIE